jgi:hypothetical protein
MSRLVSLVSSLFAAISLVLLVVCIGLMDRVARAGEPLTSCAGFECGNGDTEDCVSHTSCTGDCYCDDGEEAPICSCMKPGPD